MEWVETTGHDVEEAKKFALEQLGVGESDAEIEVLAEPKIGLFGRLKEEARVRARVRPRYPRAKGERRDRRRRGTAAAPSSEVTPTSSPGGGDSRSEVQASVKDLDSEAQQLPQARRRSRRAVSSTRDGSSDSTVTAPPSPEQVQRGEEFLRGLLVELGMAATVAARPVSDESVELSIEGHDLGTFIGPKGATLLALQELTRVVSQRRANEPGPGSRLLLDINGYRRRRQEALVRFVEKVAAEVRTTNSRRALEPMNAADRKTVHDAVNTIPGVSTVSEGEDPYRRVVLMPTELEGQPSQASQ